jgi:cysteine desulfuration protein SufE
MTINEIQDEIIEEFSGFDDWMDKYQLLIDLGNEQEPLEEKYKTEQNLIDGCQSRVWLVADYVKESGDGSQESGDGSQESGDGSQETGDGSQESGDGSQETGDRSQESGDRSQETGDRSQETGVIHFRAESDALIVKGIVALLIRVLSGHTAQEILDADLYFIEEIGLKEHLSPTRSNGLVAMVKQMRSYALAFSLKR